MAQEKGYIAPSPPHRNAPTKVQSKKPKLKRGVCAALCFSIMSWLCVFLLIFTLPSRIDVYPSRAHADACLFHTDLFAKGALFDGASLTSHVIRSTVPDEWVSTTAAVPDALAPELVRQVDVDQKHWVADEQVPLPVSQRVKGVSSCKRCAASLHPARDLKTGAARVVGQPMSYPISLRGLAPSRVSSSTKKKPIRVGSSAGDFHQRATGQRRVCGRSAHAKQPSLDSRSPRSCKACACCQNSRRSGAGLSISTGAR